MKKSYSNEHSEKDYIKKTKELRAPFMSSFFERAMVLFDSKGNFLFYSLIHGIGIFAAEAIVCLFFITGKDTILISGVSGAILFGTICAVIRDKMKIIYALRANVILFLVWTMYLFVFVTGLIGFLFGL